MQKEIRHTWFYPQSPEEVWDYLTKSELMAQWLMKNDFEPILGYDFQFRTNPLPKFDFDGIAYCKVLEIVPCKRLSYSWKGGPGDGKITLDSVVEWTLSSKDKGTELLLVHTGFRELENYAIYNAMNDGWLKNIKKIGEFLNSIHGTANA